MEEQLNTEEPLTRKEEIFSETMAHVFLTWQLFKFALKELNQSDTPKAWAALAKASGNKKFVDLRVLAAEQLRYVDSFMMKMKQGIMKPETFREIMVALSSDQMYELANLLSETCVLSEESVKSITQQVIDGKKLADELNKQNNNNEVSENQQLGGA